MTVTEVNFDGLVGPTHNYAGLSLGNLASATNQGEPANPKQAALQGLAKMRHMLSLGMVQGVLPPHDRPRLAVLRSLGFTGSDETVLAQAWSQSPLLVRNLMSASAMWTANAATVTPKFDTEDGRTHFTPANLGAMYHRANEPETTGRILKAIFADDSRFAHHPAIPGGAHMGDEGAANHSRLCADHGQAGLGVFVYGSEGFELSSGRFPARQVLEASQAVARTHGVRHPCFIRQSPVAIEGGAFHNDVVAVANETVLFHHEQAFADTHAAYEALRRAAEPLGFEPIFVQVPAERVSLEEAVRSYLFNSQLVSVPGRNGHTLVAPVEVREIPAVNAYLDDLLAGDSPIAHADIQDLRQSMRNGGGPACLRLRVVLDQQDRASLGAKTLLDDDAIGTLETWVNTHYRDRLVADDLGDPSLMRDSFTALDELTQILDLGPVYEFQR